MRRQWDIPIDRTGRLSGNQWLGQTRPSVVRPRLWTVECRWRRQWRRMEIDWQLAITASCCRPAERVFSAGARSQQHLPHRPSSYHHSDQLLPQRHLQAPTQSHPHLLSPILTLPNPRPNSSFDLLTSESVHACCRLVHNQLADAVFLVELRHTHTHTQSQTQRWNCKRTVRDVRSTATSMLD